MRHPRPLSRPRSPARPFARLNEHHASSILGLWTTNVSNLRHLSELVKPRTCDMWHMIIALDQSWECECRAWRIVGPCLEYDHSWAYAYRAWSIVVLRVSNVISRARSVGGSRAWSILGLWVSNWIDVVPIARDQSRAYACRAWLISSVTLSGLIFLHLWISNLINRFPNIEFDPCWAYDCRARSILGWRV